jgi:hypothetical protein
MDSIRASSDDASAKGTEDASREEKKARKSRHSAVITPGRNSARYFLGAEGLERDGSPLVLGAELATEEEVLVAAFRKDLPFYRVETWRARAEKKGRNMVLRKQS